ncbi:hypothetical protein [Streptomyces achromogenes]
MQPNTSPPPSGADGTEYIFSDDPADWIEYEKKQFRLILGSLTRRR